MKTASKWLQNALENLHRLCLEERQIGVQILEWLAEVERRKAYSELGYDGLYSFCVRELKFSESQAFQRIQAMHALKSTPELKEKIESGSMSVTNVAQVQVFLRQEKARGVKREELSRRELFGQFENKSSKEVKKEIQALKGETVRQKLLLELDAEAESLWFEVRAKSAHQTQGDALKCFKLLMKEFLKAVPKTQRTISGSIQRTQSQERTVESQEIHESRQGRGTRHVPVHIKRAVLARDQGRCVACGSSFALQFEHLVPYSKNGSHSVENLTLLCRSCNLHQGIQQFGLEKMRR